MIAFLIEVVKALVTFLRSAWDLEFYFWSMW